MTDKDKHALDELKRIQGTLEETIKTGEDICGNLAIQRDKLQEIHKKVKTVDSALDESRATLRKMDNRRKYWWIPWY